MANIGISNYQDKRNLYKPTFFIYNADFKGIVPYYLYKVGKVSSSIGISCGYTNSDNIGINCVYTNSDNVGISCGYTKNINTSIDCVYTNYICDQYQLFRVLMDPIKYFSKELANALKVFNNYNHIKIILEYDKIDIELIKKYKNLLMSRYHIILSIYIFIKNTVLEYDYDDIHIIHYTANHDRYSKIFNNDCHLIKIFNQITTNKNLP